MSSELIIGFFTLTALEIVLGIDNLVFISILSSKLPEGQRARARNIGIGLALVSRLLLLFSIAWIMGLTEPWFTLFGHGFSGQAIILLAGGLFLIGKATYEIHESLEGEEDHKGAKVAASFASVIVQIVLLDLVFSLDSVITAVGMIGNEEGGIYVMVAAVVVACVVMLVVAGPLSRFVHNHPTVKMLALAFLLLIGMTLLGEGVGFHIEKGFVYTAMGFSLFVEVLNLLAGKRRRAKAGKKAAAPVKLASRYSETGASGSADVSGAPGSTATATTTTTAAGTTTTSATDGTDGSAAGPAERGTSEPGA